VTINFVSIKDAENLLEGKVLRTPTIYSPIFSELSGAEVWLKLENL
jgi:threonine dehydratase